MPSLFLLSACAVSRKLFCPFPLHVMQVIIVYFVYCVRIVSAQRLSRAADIVHFVLIFEHGVCYAVHSSVLFHRAIFCISRIFLCAP